MIKKRYLYSSIIISIILVSLGYILYFNLYDYHNTFIPQRDDLSFFKIFIGNFSSCMLMLLLSLLGPIALLIIMKLLFSLGIGIHMTEISYSTTLIKTLIGFSGHALGEVTSLAIIMMISIHVTIGWIKYLCGKDISVIKNTYKYYYWKKIGYIIIFIAIILLCSSIIEVYWSAPYFDKLYVK